MNNHPPRWARRFLQWYCHPRLLEDIEGDLHELFEERLSQQGLRKARLLYVWDVARSLRFYHLKQKSMSVNKPFSSDMVQNYFTIAMRHLWRSKVYSLLNISGLASGLAVSLLILLFVVHELSYDRFHTHSEQIVVMNGSFSYDGQQMTISGLAPAVGPSLKESYAEVEAFVRMSTMNRVTLGSGDTPQKKFREDKWLLADSSFLSVFSFKLLSGDRRTALSRPGTVLLTPGMAHKYFGHKDPIGQTLTLFFNPDPFFKKPAGSMDFTVSGIIEPAPSTSSIEYNFVASFHSLASFDKEQFEFPQLVIGSYTTYFLLNSHKAIDKVEKGLNAMVKPVMDGVKQELRLISMEDLHLKSPASSSNLTYLYIFTAVALLILLLALINYISLTTARASLRAKEIGIRKVIGARRRQLMGQFFGESFLMTLFAFTLAALLIWLALPYFYHIIGIKIPVSFLVNPSFVVLALAVLLGSGLLSGIYPAFLLSGLIPVEVLKGKFASQRGGAMLRRVFTVFQFAASICLIICSLIMQGQLDFIRSKDIGLDKDRLVVIPLEAKGSGKNYHALKNELSGQSFVQSVSASTGVPFKADGTNSVFTQTKTKQQINLYFNNVDEQFMSTFQIGWKEKPVKEISSTAGNQSIILNETAADKLGLGKQGVGKKIPFSQEKREVIGIVKDFNFMSLQQSISPLALFIIPDTVEAKLMNYGGYLSIRLKEGAELKESLIELEEIYGRYEQDTPFEYFFLDAAFNSLYKSQDRLAAFSGIFTGLAILISCLGLFGLSAFTAERRTKEIGIRKVLGASVGNILALLSKDFLRLVLLSFVIAAPLAGYFMQLWMQEFAYQAGIGIGVFLLSGGIGLLIALFTVSYQSIKAVLTNPVNSLRNE